MKELSDIYKSDQDKNEKHLLENYKGRIKLKHDYYKSKIINIMSELLSFAEDQKIITYT